MWHVSVLVAQILSFLGEDELTFQPKKDERVALFETCKLLCVACDRWLFTHCMKNAAHTVPKDFKWRLKRALKRRTQSSAVDMGSVRLVAHSLRPNFVLYALHPSLRRRRFIGACSKGRALLGDLYPNEEAVVCVAWEGIFKEGVRQMSQIPHWAVQRHTFFRIQTKTRLLRLTRVFSARARVPRQWLTFRCASTGEEIFDKDCLWGRDVTGITVTMDLGRDWWLVNVVDEADLSEGTSEESSTDDDAVVTTTAPSLFDACDYGFHRQVQGIDLEEVPDNKGRPLQPRSGWLFRVHQRTKQGVLQHAREHARQCANPCLQYGRLPLAFHRDTGLVWLGSGPPRLTCELTVIRTAASLQGCQVLVQYRLAPVTAPSFFFPRRGLSLDFTSDPCIDRDAGNATIPVLERP